MKIGILADAYKPYVSGVSTSIFVLAEGLIKEGHEVYILTPKCKGYKEYDKDYAYIKRISGGITLPKKGTRFLKYVPFVGRHLKKIKELDLDVIHVHSELTIGKLALKAKKKLNIPLVYTVHTMYEEYMHFVSKFLAKYFHNTLLNVVKRRMRRFITNSDITIVPSKKIENLMLSYDIEGDYQILPTGIHLDVFKKENHKKEDVLKLKKKYNIKEDDFVCLFVGRISLEKDIDVLIDGFKEIKNENIKFVIVGGGPYLGAIKERVLKEGLKEKAIFTGIIEREEVSLHYQLGDVFLNASISETQGLTYIEALAAGLPLIVRYDEVLENVVTDGYNGLFFYEPEKLPEKIMKVYNNKKLFNKLQKNTSKSVLKYDHNIYIENILKVYNMAIEKRKKETSK